MTSRYTPEQLDHKAKQIVHEAKEASIREARSFKDAIDRYWKEQGHQGSYPGDSHVTEAERNKYKSWLNDQYDWIPQAFAEYSMPQPKNFDGIISACASVSSQFGEGKDGIENPNIGLVGKALTDMGKWDGAYSENLQDNLLSPLKVILSNQGKIANQLHGIMVETKKLYEKQQLDISSLADETLNALKHCGDFSGPSPDDVKMGLTIFNGLVGVAGAALAFPTGGTSIAAAGVVLASVGAASSVASELVPDKNHTVPLAAGTVREVIDNMSSVMQKISSHRIDQEQVVCKALDKDYKLIVDLRQLANSKKESGPIVPLRPTIDDAKDPSSGLYPERIVTSGK